MGNSQHLLARGRAVRSDPAAATRELWAYLHVDDAARAVLLGLNAKVNGAVVLNIVAGDSLGGVDVAQCARALFTSPTFREPIPAGRCAYDTSRAESLLGFTSRIRWDAADPEPTTSSLAG